MLAGIESGAIRVQTRDLTEPSPLALEVLSARPYAYLDDAPLEERRTQAVMSRRWMSPEAASDLGKLDAEAVARVRSEAWPEPANADELHDALAWLGFLTESEATEAWRNWLAELAGQNWVARMRPPTLPSPRKRGEGMGGGLWIPAERLPHFRALWPQAELDPPIAAPATYDKDASSETALTEILRGRLEGLGPVTEAALAAPLGLQPAGIAGALAALEAEGFAMRGRFTPDATADEWCERRLLARIHHYTVKRLRAEIQPVAARDFMRFLLRWQRVAGDARMQGPDAVDTIVGQLEGFEAPAGAWESEILAARIADYEPDWLDDRCLAGKITWKRLRPVNGRTNGSERRASPLRTTPITLLPRRHAAHWSSLSGKAEARRPSPRAQEVVEYIRQHGASFFDELVENTGLLRAQLEDALAELVALGLVSSDSFGGLRALLVPSTERRPTYRGRRRRRAKAGMDDAGRWTLAHRAAPAQGEPDAIEHVARTLLNRYGVVFWRLLEREAAWLPPWRDLLRVYRRLEARGDIRGGRFVAGFSGEQFALPDAVGALREVCRAAPSGAWISLSGADPLNLCGILSPGPRLAALTGNRLLYRDGIPVAFLAGGDVQFLEELDERSEWEARKALLLAATPAPSILPTQDGLHPQLRQSLTRPRPSPAR